MIQQKCRTPAGDGDVAAHGGRRVTVVAPRFPRPHLR